MSIYSIIQKSQLEGALRLDAEYYQPEYLLWLQQLKRFNLLPLKKLARKIDVGYVSSMTDHFQNDGIPLLRTQNVKEFYIDLESDVIYIDEEFHRELKKTQVFPEDVLLARSGSIGDACLVPDNFPSANSADIISIRFLEKIIPEYLVTFLNSKYGRFQIDRGISGGLQGHINLYSLEKLLVPIFDNQQQEQIRQIVLSGLDWLKKSKGFYMRAENLLLEKLGLVGEKFEDKLSYVVNSSDTKSANRIDADYFQPKYKKLIKSLGVKLETLGHIVTRKTKKIKALPEVDYKYIEISSVNISSGKVLFSRIKGKDLPANAKVAIDGGELVVSKVRPTRGAIAIIPDNWNQNFVASGAFSVFEVKSPMREYLQLILRSVVGELQLEKPTTGTSYPTVTDKDIEELIIPILPKSTQQKIANLVRQSHEARRQSEQLLEKAKREVERTIEEEVKK